MSAFRDIDHRIAALAGAQGGVVSRSQLRAIGLRDRAIGSRQRAGKLHRLHRGVYAVGHRVVSREGRWWAAILAVGPGAALSHASAAALWELRAEAGARIDVTVGPGGRTARAGLRLHRRHLPPSDVTTHTGIPVTTPARTVLDLAATGLHGRPLEALLDRAEHRRLLDFADLRRLTETHRGRPGAPAVRVVLARYSATSSPTRSELEERFIALCDRYGIERPRVNSRVAGLEVDFHWPARRLVVEVDGYSWHRSPAALEADRERDVRLVLAGLRVLRFTWEQVTRRPRYVADATRRGVDATRAW